MSFAPRLDIRQTQSLVMTPQLQQAIKLLALSNLEVEAFVAEEIERNPLLESAGPEGSDVPAPRDAPPEPAVQRDGPAGADELVRGEAGGAEPSLDLDYATESHQQDGASDGGGGADGSLGLNGLSGAGPEDGPDLDGFAAAAPSLRDHLMGQAGTLLSGLDLLIAEQLIDLLDEAGYLTAPLSEVADRLGLDENEVERVLAVVQTLEPTGVGARGLAECLSLQAREADRLDPCMVQLLRHLDVLARGDLNRLKRLCDVDDEDLGDMIRELRGYDPKPGCRYGGEAALAVVPDLFVTRGPEGWSVELNGATLPRVLVNRRYHAELAAGIGKNKTGRAWLGEQLQGASWLTKALDQRRRTILAVASEIVRQQEGFFTHGVARMKPLTLARVAEAVGMHESTVSRVTSNKYLACARGQFELKYFFTSGVPAADGGGEGVSAEAIKSAIRRLIAAEGDAVLSDDALVEMLGAEGYALARRTVAKYREAIGIGSSVQRRRARTLERA